MTRAFVLSGPAVVGLAALPDGYGVVIVPFVLGIGRARECADADNPGPRGAAVATATGRGTRSSAEDDRSGAAPHRS
ncbi:hypothetical protein [Actinomycetospora chiangmaiensis]|uniref:hypothetical protein n=1 Tax=Actinomycetospora chiangmaiensis TaxID=402650 RepID=UPI0003AA6C54|nr:hypothetical protein [Actinomycetospora chiangmaiensis]